jgi:serine/threonine protein kinase
MFVSTLNVRAPETPARRFRTGERRREGRTGVSFFGTDPELNVPVVVKVFRPEAFPSTLERQRVARELSRLVAVRHPSLARVLASGDEGGLLWVARDWIEGQPLHERLNVGVCSPDEVASWGAQLAGALGELHRVMLLHRDVRPAHVILALDGRARLVDASCGRHFSVGEGKTIFGTPGFAAPEALSGKLVNARSDLYSLGATLFAALEGAPPFGQEESAAIEKQLRADPPRITRGPAGLSDAIGSMLSREPRERPFHAQQVERVMEGFFTPARSATVDDDGPPTSAVDQDAVARALAMQHGPSIVDDDFDDAAATEVSRPAEPAAQVSPPRSSTLPDSPAPSLPHSAPTSAPPVSAGSASVMRRATLIGLAGAPVGASSPSAIAAAPVLRRAPLPSSVASGSAVDDIGSDFDDEEHTDVSEDSRIFGHARPDAASAHGTAVPPLPEGIASRVLQKGGTVDSPIETRPSRPSAHPPPARLPTDGYPRPQTASGAFVAPVVPIPTARPSIPPLLPSAMESAAAQTMTANVDGVSRADISDAQDAQSNVSVTAQSPVDWAGSEAAQAGLLEQARGPQPVGFASPSLPPPSAMPPAAPVASSVPVVGPPAVPSAFVSAGPVPSRPPTGAYASPHVAHPSHPMSGGPAGPHSMPPSNRMTGGYPSPYVPPPTGAYPSPPHSAPGPYTGAYPVGPGTGWTEQPPRPTTLWPWIAAGCVIAAVAGGTGYGLAMRNRDAEAPGIIVQTRPGASESPAMIPTTPASTPGLTLDGAAVVQTSPLVAEDAGVVLVPTIATVPVTAPVATPVNPPVTPTTSPARQDPSVRAPTAPTPATPLQQARTLLSRREFPAARSILESWTRSHPSDANAWLMLGDARFSMGELRPAGDAYRSAMSSGGYARRYWQRLVDRQISIGDRRGAVNTLNSVLQHRPGDRDASRQLLAVQGGRAP